MPTIQANLQGFQHIASDAALAAKDIRFSASSDTLSTRGSFMSRLVSTFMPQLARRQNQAAAEAFVAAVKYALDLGHSGAVASQVGLIDISRSLDPLKGAHQLPRSHKDVVISSLRESLSRQLTSGERLTGADVARSLAVLQDKVLLDGHFAKMQAAQKTADSVIKLSALHQPRMQRQDNKTPDSSAADAVLFKYLKTQADTLPELYQSITDQHMDVHSRLRELIRNSPDDQKELFNNKLLELDAAMNQLKSSYQKVFDPQGGSLKAVSPPSDQGAPPPTPPLAPKGILKARADQQIHIDPHAKMVDDGTNTEVEIQETDVQALDAERKLKVDAANAELASQSPVEPGSNSKKLRFAD